MCGIVGYIGQRQATPILVHGLQALEYRGYDSAGVAVVTDASGIVIKRVGRVKSLEAALADDSSDVTTGANLGVGHTRWATHGAPTINNAHPHTNTARTIFIVHNGIIENYTDIRK